MNKARRIGYAVVGLGHISQKAVLPAFRHSKSAKLVALVSGDRKKAKRLAADYGASAWHSYDELDACLANPGVQAVFIATDNATHARFSIQAAEAGRHVLCEKPMATTVEECRQMIRACRDNKVRLMIAYRKYFEPASLALKRLLRDGSLGRIKIVHSGFSFLLPHNKNGESWRLYSRGAGGGPLADVGVYCVNTTRWLLGAEPLEASAYSWNTDAKRFGRAEENIAFQLRFPDGLLLQASASFGAAKASFLKVLGEKGWATLDPAFAYDEERRLVGKIEGRWFEMRFRIIDEFALELDAFAAGIRQGRDPEPNGREGLRDVLVMQAIHQAAREGGWTKTDFSRESV